MNERSIFPQCLGDVNADFRFGILTGQNLYTRVASAAGSFSSVDPGGCRPPQRVLMPEASRPVRSGTYWREQRLDTYGKPRKIDRASKA